MGTEVLVTHYSRRSLALSISCTKLWQWWWTEIHTSATKSDTTIILTRNVTWNSSAPNATPITSYPLTRAMAGGAPCWPAQHCHLRAKALLNWLQPYSLVAWNREACLMSLLKFNRFIKTWIYSQGDLRCCLLLQTEVKQVAILVAQNFLHKINIGK